MWCGTCHSPHEKPVDTVSYYRARCLGCHDQAVVAETHAEPADDCVSCHMTRRQSRDSGHSAFTDHLIARRPTAKPEGVEAAPRLRAWREPPDKTLATRNLGLAYLEIGRRKEREDSPRKQLTSIQWMGGRTPEPCSFGPNKLNR